MSLTQKTTQILIQIQSRSTNYIQIQGQNVHNDCQHFDHNDDHHDDHGEDENQEGGGGG